ncbi:MAG: hypothetical protein IAE84_10155, partial [Saprospiraceae bacterium]|nr:hypothetical protein [Saprospiraceae bacterium]
GGGNAYASAGACTPTTTYGNGLITHYKNLIVLPGNSNCTTFGDVQPSQSELYNAVQCLCNLGFINPESVSNNVYPNENIARVDLAKLVYLLLYPGNQASPAELFPVPFDDLQEPYLAYYRYAKALSYLEYGDGVSPFDRDKINFRPYDGISRKYALKVLLEALNIQPDNSAPSPCADINPGIDGYGYVKEAYDKGWFAQNGAPCNSNSLMTRGDMFIILHRVLNTGGQSCNPENTVIPAPAANDYFIPGNFTSWNMARQSGYSEGYFPSYSKTSFSIPGKGLTMSFSHNYNSRLTEIPKEFMPVKPLGEGWTHNYNAYIIDVPGWTEGSTVHPEKLYVFWPDGGIHMYDKATLLSQSEGVYDVLTVLDSDTYLIKAKNQMRYTFTQKASNTAPGGNIWMLTEIKDRNNNKINIVYHDANGNPRINYVIDDSNRKIQFNYLTGTGNKIFYVGDVAGSRYIYFTYDGDDLKTYKNARNYTTTYHYYTDPARKHLLTNILLPEGNNITNIYNTNRKLESTRIGVQPPTAISITNDFANPNSFINSSVTDPHGDVVNHTFNKKGQVNGLALGANGMTMNYEDPLNPTLPTSTTYNGYNVSYEYDNRGNVTKITLPTGLTHQYTWTAENDIDTYTDPKGGVTDFAYDANKNMDYIQDPMGFITQFSINNQGLMTSMSSPTNITYNFEYYPSGDLKKVISPLGFFTEMYYDNIGRVTSIKNPNNQITQMEYSPTDFVKKVTNVMNTGNIVTQYVYDKNDLVREVQNGRGFKTFMSYTERDLLDVMSFGNDATDYDWRNDNLLDKVTKPDGSVFQMLYDALGRVENDGHVAYTYDNQDNVLTMQVIGSPNTLVMTYDVLNRLKTATYDNKTVTYDYDNNSNISRITYPGNAYVINYVHDANNRLTQVKVTNTILTKYFYRSDGLLDSLWNNNGTNNKYLYDGAGRMMSMTTKRSDGQVICSYLFDMDNNGNHLVESKTEQLPAPSFISQSLTSDFNIENEIDNLGNANFTFNPNGAQTQKGTNTYTWNNVEQLTGMSSGKTFTYDAFGLLRTATRNGALTKYVWDIMGMGNLLMTTDGNGNLQDYYIYGLGLIARRSAGGVYSFYHYDFRGSTVAITDASQNITHKYQYDAYGRVLQKVEANSNPFQFVGQHGVMYEGDSLSYMRARWYDASTGRFLSEDPVWATNLYAYAGGNPVMRVDPDGEQFVEAYEYYTTANDVFSIWKTVNDGWGGFNLNGKLETRCNAAGKVFSFGALEILKQVNLDPSNPLKEMAKKDIRALPAYIALDQKISETVEEKFTNACVSGISFADQVAYNMAYDIATMVTSKGGKYMPNEYIGPGAISSMPYSPNVNEGQVYMTSYSPKKPTQSKLGNYFKTW